MYNNVIGQQRLVAELSAITAGLKAERGKSLNILLRGPGGCGKTFLAKQMCFEISGNMYSFQIPIPKFLMTPNIENLRCHLVDEIHTLKRIEDIYPYMDCGRYIFLFCTTNTGLLPEPFTSRCLIYTFDDYTLDQIVGIAELYSTSLGFPLAEATALLIAERSRGSPRLVKKYVDRLYFMITQGRYPKTINGVKDAFDAMGVYRGGYTDMDKKYLLFLSNVKRASLNMISASTDIDKDTIATTIEPFLLDKGLIRITHHGREYVEHEGRA